MKSKDQILLEQAYQKVLNENEQFVVLRRDKDRSGMSDYTEHVVGKASTLKRAGKILDKKDNEYGTSVHYIERAKPDWREIYKIIKNNLHKNDINENDYVNTSKDLIKFGLIGSRFDWKDFQKSKKYANGESWDFDDNKLYDQMRVLLGK